MRRSMPWKLASARQIAASATPSSLATAIAASALSTLWVPAMLSMTGNGLLRPGNATLKRLPLRSRVRSVARTSTPSRRP